MTLNPYAPAFIPMAYYDVVEDFSDAWWSLVHSSPWFRDYWLRECYEDPQSDDLLLSDLDSFFDDFFVKQDEVEDEKFRSGKEMISVNKWSKVTRGRGEAHKFEKAPKIVSVKVSPRPIQQPR